MADNEEKWIVIKIDGANFSRFSLVHDFEKPNDERALELMNSCAVAVLEEFPNVIFAYGFSDEYSFVVKEMTQNRRRETQLMLFFSDKYATKWNEFFPHKQLQYQPNFHAKADVYSTSDVGVYLASRQNYWENISLHHTCFWMLVKSGKSEDEAHKLLMGPLTGEGTYKNFLEQFGIDYNALPAMIKTGSSVSKIEVEDGEESQMKVVVEHTDITATLFWKKNLGGA